MEEMDVGLKIREGTRGIGGRLRVIKKAPVKN
jgi:hypothetical protein